ncbi:MAG: tripartite tricarboxylate transporter permease, partial [Deltaproteobacteria bacterium]|nr:tripartite tricarboxylate transporter permease [Deltaproteobacteria bacterium]
EVAVWISYGQAKQTSRHPELFGTGYAEGIIAPESSMNAKEGGALLTTLCLGLPGSLSMALLMGALLMQNVIPGPAMLKDNLELTFTLIWGLGLANLIGAILCFVIIGYLNLTWLMTLPPRVLVPTIICIVFLGAHMMDNEFGDIIVMIVFTGIGMGMKRWDYNRATLVLGLILGSYFEDYFFLALQTLGPFFFLRPASLVIIAITVGLYLYRPVVSFLERRSGRFSMEGGGAQ